MATTHYNCRPICKQEVTGSIPVGSIDLAQVADRPNHEIVPLSVALENMPDRQTSYTAMLDRMSYQRAPQRMSCQFLLGTGERSIYRGLKGD
jgi:hypothetical protein